jgi:hyperosmotically inducible protein
MMRIVALLLMFVLCVAPVFAQKGSKSDGEIHDQVLIRLAGDQDVKGTGIDVEVKDGAVTLIGKVESDKIRSRAEKLAKKVKGVKSVENKLTVGPR